MSDVNRVKDSLDSKLNDHDSFGEYNPIKAKPLLKIACVYRI